jgi:hypothetical protein
VHLPTHLEDPPSLLSITQTDNFNTNVAFFSNFSFFGRSPEPRTFSCSG